MDDEPRAEWFGFPREVVLGAFAAVVIVALVAGITLGHLVNGSPSAVAKFTSVPPTDTSAPTAPATPSGPRILDSPTLGGTQDEWTAVFGQPATGGVYPMYSVTTSEGYQVVLCFCDTQAGTDGGNRDARIGLTPQSGATVTSQQIQAILPRYLPPDAKHVRDFTDPQIGLIHVYSSADLAATFPASDFTDSNSGQSLPPGTFSEACDQPGASVPECDVVLGD